MKEISDNQTRGAGLTRPILLAVLVGISIFFTVFFILSPKAFSQKETGNARGIAPQDTGGPGPAALAEPAPALSRRYDFRLSDADTFYRILSYFNLSGVQTQEIIQKTKAVYDLRALKKGEVLRVYAEGNRIDAIEYRISDFEMLNITRDASAPEGFKAARVELPHEMRTMTVSGTIQNSLYEDGIKAGADAQGIMNFSDIFAWDVDFAADIRKGDTFKIYYETHYVDGKYLKTGKILGAEIVSGGRRVAAVYFEGGDGKAGYYDEDGKSLRRMLLKSPLRFSRISSRFTTSRFHPILKMYRPHHGIDYAAPTGTPVEASGSGRVVSAGWKSGYGNFIELKHPNGYVTGYGHLSRIGKGVSPGRAVEQGEVIGYVGSTGISTGPHLHYEIKVNGSLINPQRIKAQPNKSVAKNDMRRFASARDEIMKKLAADTIAVASRGNVSARN
ncbi:MAG: peptidoglycan DD-metalloendopeptidase family protein [Deltaproteobacteria bacterium]|nr:peptidoglycan DD-metalloendopeptidase family protein [Deltaproteobacteria bacterium]